MKTEIPAVPYQSGQSNRQPVDVKKEIPSLPDQSQLCVPQSVIMESLQNQSSSAVIPPVGNLLKNDAGPSLGGKVMPQQFVKPELDNQSAPVMVKPEHEVFEQDEVLEEVEKTAIMEGPTGAEFEKALKTVISCEPFADIQGNETVCNDPQGQPQAVGSERYYLVQDEVKSLNGELCCCLRILSPVISVGSFVALQTTNKLLRLVVVYLFISFPKSCSLCVVCSINCRFNFVGCLDDEHS